jgi:catechol 2,3-dioxygenase-like lactoylglutathione lyase family enzyme
MMPTHLTYVILFVDNMDQSVQFYRDRLGLPLKFQSPEWSEFGTGATTLALHPASAVNPAGKLGLGFSVPDLQAFYEEMSSSGVKFTQPPKSEVGAVVARFLDAEGNECSVSQA